MVLSQQQVIDFCKLKENPNIDLGETLQDDHKVHIQGVGYENLLKQIIGYETVEQNKQKKLLTKPFTKPLFKELINTLNRWKTAQGTNKYYKFKGTGTKYSEQFKNDVLKYIFKDMSMDNFIKSYHSKAIYEEFNGFYIVEKPILKDGIYYREGVPVQVKDGKTYPYICFKNVSEIENFAVTGNRVEWIIFDYGKIERNGKEIELYRVIDDVKDYIVEEIDKETYVISNEFPVIEHMAGRCPAVRVSNINKFINNDFLKTSPLDSIIELADYALHQFAEHVVTELLHAHAKFFQVAQKCTHTHNGGQCVDGHISYMDQSSHKTERILCPNCKGLSHNNKFDSSSIIILPQQDGEGKPYNMTNVAGYITPPIDILKYQRESHDWLRAMIKEAVTNIKSSDTGQAQSLVKTATEVTTNVRPLEDVISDIIEMIQETETSLTNIIGKMTYNDKYESCEIIYGKKLNLKDENTLLQEIKDLRTNGGSNISIKSVNEEYVYTRFVRSESDLSRNELLFEIEPLVGMTFSEVESSANISRNIKILKQNFTDLIEQFENQYGDIVEFKAETDRKIKIAEIKKILNTFVAQIISEIPTETEKPKL